MLLLFAYILKCICEHLLFHYISYIILPFKMRKQWHSNVANCKQYTDYISELFKIPLSKCAYNQVSVGPAHSYLGAAPLTYLQTIVLSKEVQDILLFNSFPNIAAVLYLPMVCNGASLPLSRLLDHGETNELVNQKYFYTLLGRLF